MKYTEDELAALRYTHPIEELEHIIKHYSGDEWKEMPDPPMDRPYFLVANMKDYVQMARDLYGNKVAEELINKYNLTPIISQRAVGPVEFALEQLAKEENENI